MISIQLVIAIFVKIWQSPYTWISDFSGSGKHILIIIDREAGR